MKKYLLLILSIIGATAFYFNAEKVKLKEEEWFIVKGEIINSSYKTHLGGTTHGVEPVIHDYIFNVEYKLNSELIKCAYPISGSEWYIDEQFEGQKWKIGSDIDVYINKDNNNQILLNPKFNKTNGTHYIVYVFCGVFGLLGLAQILGKDIDEPIQKKSKKKKKKKKNKK